MLAVYDTILVYRYLKREVLLRFKIFLFFNFKKEQNRPPPPPTQPTHTPPPTPPPTPPRHSPFTTTPRPPPQPDEWLSIDYYENVFLAGEFLVNKIFKLYPPTVLFF